MRSFFQRPVVFAALLHFAAAAACAWPGEASEMRPVPAGVYVPILRGKDDVERVSVAAFLLEEHAVTNGEFLEFVRANPQWRRSEVSPLFADGAYLAHWSSDLDPGANAPADAPVVRVSWFAARGYAKWKGWRLPKTAEWELAAQAGFDRLDGKSDPAMRRRILDWLSTPIPDIFPDAVSGRPDFNGVHNLHGLIWEWVDDFNTAMVTGESRADAGLDRNNFCGAGAIGARETTDYPAFMRLAFRSSLRANYCVANLGFRCAKSLGEDLK